MRVLAHRRTTLITKVLIEFTVVMLSYCLTLNLRFDGNVPRVYTDSLEETLLLLGFSRIFSIWLVTRYRLQWHSTSLEDLLYLVAASVPGSILFVTLHHVFIGGTLPRSIILLEWAFSLCLLLTAHLAVRVLWTRTKLLRHGRVGAQRRVLVVGAGDAGQRIAKLMKEDTSANLLPVAFVDDDRSKRRVLIQGMPVIGSTDEVPALARHLHIDQVLIAIPSLSSAGLNRMLQKWSGMRVEITMLPSLPALLEGKVGTHLIRKVCVEDLLKRTPVTCDMDAVASYLEGQRVLVTGAGGSIGSELCRQILAFKPERLILLGQGEHSIFLIDQELRAKHAGRLAPVIANIKDRSKLEMVFRTHRPTVVFHAAAHKHVPLMEMNPEEAVKNNIFGTRNLAELSVEFGVRQFVMISTDKAVNPSSVMGASKRVAEMLVQSLAQRCDALRRGDAEGAYPSLNGIHTQSPVTEFACVRFGNVLGSRGSVIPTMQKQIEAGGPITVTHPDMERFFMTIPEAVQLVIQAGSMGGNGCIFLLDMGQPVKIVDLATNLIHLSGLTPGKDIRIDFTGIRPGEKLYEEVLTAEEGVTVTSNEKIFRARASTIDHVALHTGLSRLDYIIRRCDSSAVRVELSRIVPSYKVPRAARAFDGQEAVDAASLEPLNLDLGADGAFLTRPVP